MLTLFAKSRILGLATMLCVTGLLLGAGCPASDVLNLGTQQSGASSPNPPTLQFTSPTARMDGQAGMSVNMVWTDSHSAGAATVLLYYDVDGSPDTHDETTITMLNEAAGTSGGVYSWNTTGVAEGIYHVAATIDDHTNAAVTVYLPYEVVIRAKAGAGQSSSLTVLQPYLTQNYKTGESVMIQWSVQDLTPQSRLYLYYDVDKNSDNHNEQLIATVDNSSGQLGSQDYGWTIPSTLPAGTYYILLRLTDGVNTVAVAYAPAPVEVGTFTAADFVRDLSQVGVAFPGVIFDGYQPYGRLGEVLAGGGDFNGDGNNDFMLVAPKSFSAIVPTRQDLPSLPPGNMAGGVGESYLIYSRGPARWPQGQSVSVSTIGGSLMGAKFVGPDFSISSSGVQDVMFIADRDIPGDGRPEIVFGIPDVNRIIEDQQDYDPLDSNTIHSTVPPAIPGYVGLYYFQADGWQPYSDAKVGTALIQDDWLLPGLKRSGMIMYVSSQASVTGQIVLMDMIGGRIGWTRPLTAPPSVGARIYPIATSDSTLWGSQLGTSDLFGTSIPMLLVSRPMDDGGAGSVKVMIQQNMFELFNQWTTVPPNFTRGINTQPACYSFPMADSTTGTDPDRYPAWPWFWYDFMSDPYFANLPPNPGRFDIMNTDKTVGANGHMGHPTGLKDFDGDLVEDAAVSAPDASPNGVAGAGAAYLIYGNKSFEGADVSQFAAMITSGFELDGTQPGEQLGWKMAGPGDINGDRYNDWLLTAPNRTWAGRTNCGAVVLIYGQSQSGPKALHGHNTLADVIPVLDGAIIYGGSANDHLGMYMAAVGDVDRDGYVDFIVSAPGYSAPGKPNCGAVYLIYGGPHLHGEFDLIDIGSPQLPGKIYVGPEANAGIGPIAGTNDVDGDNYPDYLIGYPGANAQGFPQSGRAWLIYGGGRTAP